MPDMTSPYASSWTCSPVQNPTEVQSPCAIQPNPFYVADRNSSLAGRSSTSSSSLSELSFDSPEREFFQTYPQDCSGAAQTFPQVSLAYKPSLCDPQFSLARQNNFCLNGQNYAAYSEPPNFESYHTSAPNGKLSAIIPLLNQSNQYMRMPSHKSNNYYGAQGGMSIGNGVYVSTNAKVKRVGGRRPKEEEEDYGMTPEEHEKKMRRRQRNKEAAARCRLRRLELIDTLQKKVDELTAERSVRDREMQQLKRENVELENILRVHQQSSCKMNGHVSLANRKPNGYMSTTTTTAPRSKPIPPLMMHPPHTKQEHESHFQPKREPRFHEDPMMPVVTSRPSIDLATSRPTSLPLINGGLPDSPGVSFTTPSGGIDFGVRDDGGIDLLGGPTGLTPISQIATPIFNVVASASAGANLDTPTSSSTMDISGNHVVHRKPESSLHSL